jgi:methionine-rich copper-binding protein CopC
MPGRPIQLLTLRLATALAALAIAPATADAHVELVASSPRAGAVLRAPAKARAVTATFSGPIRSGTIVVENRSGVVVSIGKGRVDPANVRRLRTTLKAGRKPGRFTVSFTVVSADGHRETGSWAFRLT